MAAITFEDVRGAFKEKTRGILEENKDRSVIKLLNATIKTFEKVVKAMDAFLKKNGVDVGKAYDESKSKAKQLLGKGKDLITEAKEKGVLRTAKDSALTATSKLSETFSSWKEKLTGPPEEDKESEGENKEKKEDKEKSKDSSSKKMNWMDRLNARQDRRKKEIEEEKRAVKEAGKAKKGGSWLGRILSGIMSLGGFLIKGIGGITGVLGKNLIRATMFSSGLLLKGIGNSLTGLIPGISSGIARSLSTLLGSAASGAGSLAWTGVKAAARSALPFLGGAAGVIGRGALMLATGPVGWAIAAGTALYAGYKLYKYLTRNDIDKNIYGQLTMLRLYTYGFAEANKEYFSKVFDLEMLMKDYTKFSNGQVTITKLDSEVVEKVLDLFNTKREEKEKYNRLNTWFQKRFIPAYRAFMTALWSTNSKVYLDDLEGLKPKDLEHFFTRYAVSPSVYNYTELPIEGSVASVVTKDQVDKALAAIIERNKKDLPKEKTLPEQVKPPAKPVVPPNKPPEKPATGSSEVKTPPPSPVKPDQKGIEGAEGESKPSTSSSGTDASTKAAGKLNIAGGQLQPGSMTFEGISTKLDKSKLINLDPNVRELFTGMAKEYNALTGKNIPVNEAFRTYEDQVAMAKKYPNKAAKPGTSLHEHGLAIDVNQNVVRELDKMGLLRKYGFTTTVGGEPWHLEPIGVSLRPREAIKDKEFRRSAIEASPGKGGGGFGLQAGSPLGRRNIALQESIFNSAGGNPVDLTKVSGKPDAATTITSGSAKSTPPTQKTTSSSGSSSGGTKATPGVSYQESEPKPATVSTNSPIKDKDPSLKAESAIPGSQAASNTDLAKYANLSPEQAIRQAAKMVGVNEETMVNFAKLESGLRSNAKASTTSATGLFQIVGGTWDELVKKHGKKYGMPADADRNNPFYNALMAAEYAKENLSKLPDYKGTGLSEETALYMTHRFGPSGGIKFIKQLLSKPDTPMEDAISPASFKANYNDVTGHTVESYAQKIAKKFNVAANTSTAAYTGAKGSKSTSSVSTASSSGSSAQSASKQTTTANANYPKPTITTARYEPTTVSSPRPTPQSSSTSAHSQMFDSTKMEGIMTDQLTQLTSIASLLSSIDGKFNIESLTAALSGVSKKPTPTPTDKRVPDTSVDLSRKKLT